MMRLYICAKVNTNYDYLELGLEEQLWNFLFAGFTFKESILDIFVL